MSSGLRSPPRTAPSAPGHRTAGACRVGLTIGIVCWLGTSGAGLALEQTRPNVVLIMTDDQGSGDFGATGNPLIETPRIDGLARESATLTSFYVSPVCSPTRASLMTGRYNYRTRCIDTWLGRSMMDPDEVTVAEVLAGAGFATGIFGKWHLGDCYPLRPIDQGFQEALVHRGGGLAQPSEPRANNGRYTDPILFQNGRQTRTRGYCTDVYFEAAIGFIKRAQEQGRNFFVYLPTNAPHGPFHDVPEALRRRYAEKPLEKLAVGVLPARRRDQELDNLARIAAMITNVDQNVGRLLDALDELGLAGNTLVIFLVDNGPNTRRYVGNRRGMKSEVFEGGVRSPLWIRWPARLPAGSTSDRIAAHIDLMPTILDACGVDAPAGIRLDGRSLLPLWTGGNAAPWPPRQLVIQSHRGDRPVRYHHFLLREQRWKLLHPSGFGRESFRGEPRFELYDLRADPTESNNLAAEHPEVVQRLREAYDRWFDDVSSTRPDNYAPPRIHVGTPHENPTVLTRQDWRGGSWAADAIGHWELHVARVGRYEITAEFDPRDVAERLQLSVGDNDYQADVKSGEREATFPNIELPMGDAQLRAVLHSGDQRRGVYQVSIRRPS